MYVMNVMYGSKEGYNKCVNRISFIVAASHRSVRHSIASVQTQAALTGTSRDQFILRLWRWRTGCPSFGKLSRHV